MQHINLSYSWTPHQEETARRHQTSPLRNALMDLLQAVREEGSIGAAAKSLSLSYRHVWGELKRWELALGQPLILWEKGQAARLTEFADKLLWAERQAQARLSPQISALQAELEKTFSVAFDPHSHVLPIFASHDDGLVLLREQAAAQSMHLDLRFCGSLGHNSYFDVRCPIDTQAAVVRFTPGSGALRLGTQTMQCTVL